MKILIVTVFVFILFFPLLAESQTKPSQYIFTYDKFISYDYVFGNNEALNKPSMIKQNPVSKEMIVLDEGNDCLYFFTENGKYLRRIGRPGQGPGDMLKIINIDFDKDGNIYVYESGNFRFSVFSKEGKYIDIILLNNIRYGTYFSYFFTDNNEIAANLFTRGFYISIISKKGEIVKQIGEIVKYDKSSAESLVNRIYAKSFIFVDNKNNYVVFLKWLPIVKMIDVSGKVIKDIDIHEELEIKDKILKPEEMVGSQFVTTKDYYLDIIYRNNRYYILTNAPKSQENILFVYVLDTDFKFIKKLYLPFKEIDFPEKKESDVYFDVVSEKENIFIPLYYNAEVVKFFNNK